MKILSWNVNSVRQRLRALSRIVETHRPDVLCLQEIKVEDASFPAERFRRLGFRHQIIAGQKSYNGVAILSRLPLAGGGGRDWCRKKDRRHVHALLPGGIELHNFYLPAGGPIPDPAKNPKFAHKLSFYRALTRWFRTLRPVNGGDHYRAVLVGDLNVAPLPEDVWSHQKLQNVVTHTLVERRAMVRLLDSLDWVDAVRTFHPAPTPLFTWWSYRAPDWRKVNKGRRLDHVWVTPAVAPSLASAKVLDRVRGWRSPSDHAPVLVELDP